MAIRAVCKKPVTVADLAAELSGIEALHNDLYVSRDQAGRVLKRWQCNNCEMCQAMLSLRSAIQYMQAAVNL